MTLLLWPPKVNQGDRYLLGIVTRKVPARAKVPVYVV
jgi:hypothetical protein